MFSCLPVSPTNERSAEIRHHACLKIQHCDPCLHFKLIVSFTPNIPGPETGEGSSGQDGEGEDGPETNQRSGCHADSMRKGFQAIGRGLAQNERMQRGQRPGSELGGTDFTKFRYCFVQPFPHLSLHFLMLFFFL